MWASFREQVLHVPILMRDVCTVTPHILERVSLFSLLGNYQPIQGGHGVDLASMLQELPGDVGLLRFLSAPCGQRSVEAKRRQSKPC